MKKPSGIITAALVAFSTVVFSQPDDVIRIQRFMGKLNLTEEQKKDIEKVHFDVAKQTVAQKAKLETARIEFQQLLKDDNPDKSTIEKKISEMADLGVQLRMIKVGMWFSVNKLLTQEQQKTWKKVLENGPAIRQKMMKDRRGKEMFQRREVPISPHPKIIDAQ
jgi:Spy/CpxP family protein refolding chaperone